MGSLEAAGQRPPAGAPGDYAVRVMGSLWCRCVVRRALQVSRRPEAPEAECVRRGSDPPLAVKQALLSFLSPVRPLIFLCRDCLPAGAC